MTNSLAIGSAPSVRTLALWCRRKRETYLWIRTAGLPGHDCYSREIRRTDAGRRAAPPSPSPPAARTWWALFSRGVPCTSHNATRSLDGHGCSRRTGPLWGLARRCGREVSWAGAQAGGRPCAARCSEYSTVCMPISSCAPCRACRRGKPRCACSTDVRDRLRLLEHVRRARDARLVHEQEHVQPPDTEYVRCAYEEAHARGRQRGAGRRRGERRASAAHVERGERGQHGNGSRHKNCGYRCYHADWCLAREIVKTVKTEESEEEVTPVCQERLQS